jgi:Protein of unknown function (DUF4235)
MKILYKPFALIAGLIGARVAKVIFRGLWSRVDDSDPPKPTTAGASFGKVVGAAAMEAATMAAVGAAVDRAGARTFQHLTGIWPGDKPEPKDDK